MRKLSKLSKREILRLYLIVHVAMENMKKVKFYLSIKLFHQYILSSLAKFQLVKCNLSLAMIWEMTYIHKLPTFSYSLTH